MSFWYEEDINLCLRVAAALASVGIFSDNILEFLSQKLNELEADQRICIRKLNKMTISSNRMCFEKVY